MQTVAQHKDLPLRWRIGLACFATLIVTGALYLLFNRGEILIVDLSFAANVLSWCF